jgi:hypothetical protein
MEINRESGLDILLGNAIRSALRNNVLFRDSISNRYYNIPPHGGYILNEEHEYILPDRDDLSSTLLLEVVTQFGSPGNDSFMKKYRKEQLKGIKYKKVKETIENNTCPICLDELKKGEYYRNLVCNHCFHKKCIDNWFKKDHSDCPMCRKRILD